MKLVIEDSGSNSLLVKEAQKQEAAAQEARESISTVETLLGRMKFCMEVGFSSTPRHMAEALTARERITMAKLLNKMLRSDARFKK